MFAGMGARHVDMRQVQGYLCVEISADAAAYIWVHFRHSRSAENNRDSGQKA